MTGQTPTLIPDDTTNIGVSAIAAHTSGCEARLREVERSGQNLPESSCGRRNRQPICARETRVAIGLRAAKQAYRTATEHDTASGPPEPTRAFRSPQGPAGSVFTPAGKTFVINPCSRPDMVRPIRVPDWLVSLSPAPSRIRETRRSNSDRRRTTRQWRPRGLKGIHASRATLAWSRTTELRAARRGRADPDFPRISA